MPSLTGRGILITGGSSGIGLATARLFLQEGAAVTITGRDPGRLEAAAAELSGLGELHTYAGDVARVGDARAMAEHAITEQGRVDYLFCSAGVPGVAALERLEEDLWDQVININLKGTYTVIRAVVPHMKALGGGAIVTMGSEAGLTGQPQLAAYCASKGGVVNLTRALALELIPSGIRVNCLCPGITDTPMCETEANMAEDPQAVWDAWAQWAPAGRWAEPAEQAKAVLFLMRDATFMIGAALVTDGGFTAR